MGNRAVHVKITCSLDTDSFFLALWRLVACQGNIRSIYSDNGSNFIGAEQELKKVYMGMDERKVQSFLQSSEMVTGSDSTRTILWQVILVGFGSHRFT